MKRDVKVDEIIDHTSYIDYLLNNQKYVPTGVILTDEERIKLYNFLYYFDGVDSKIRFNDHYPEKDYFDKLKTMNEDVFDSMDDEIVRIVNKCLTNPHKLFLSNSSFETYSLNKQIVNSLFSSEIARVGGYNITRKYNLIIDTDDNNNAVKITNGASIFEVRDDKDILILYFDEKYQDIRFKGIQLNSSVLNYSDNGLLGVLLCLDDIMNFFSDFEKTLSDQLYDQNIVNSFKKKILTADVEDLGDK